MRATMSETKSSVRIVMVRTKHDKTPPRRRLADHPAMTELSRMVTAGAVDRTRTIAYLKKEMQP